MPPSASVENTAGRRADTGRWTIVLFAVALYEALYVGGGIFHTTAPNVIGIAGFLAILVVGTPQLAIWNRFTFRIAAWPLAALLVACLVHPGATEFTDLTKFSLFYVLIIVFSSTLREPVHRTPLFSFYRFLVIVPLAASVVIGGDQNVLGDVRMAGLFVNGNSLALLALLLPSILPPEASRTQRLAVDICALAIIIMTRTSGALLAYVLGASLGRLNARRAIVFACLGLVVAVLVILNFHEVLGALSHSRATERVALQAQAIADASSDLRSGAIDFGTMSREYGASVLSGVWRLVHWSRILDTFAHGGWDVWSFGFGPGSAHLQLEKLPHNDYLRVLYEQGVVGLVAFGAFYLSVLRRIAPHCRTVVIAYLIYSLSENNLDNFLFSALFSLMIATNLSALPQQHLSRSRRRWRGFAPVALSLVLLASCGSRCDVDSHATPAPAAVAVNSLQTVLGDMFGEHEGIPHGVPDSLDWKRVPRLRLQRIPNGFNAITAWGQIYEDENGIAATNTRVELRHLRTYVLLRSDGHWHEVQHPGALIGKAYREDFRMDVGDATLPPDVRVKGEQLAAKLVAGRNYHFYPPRRAAIDPSDVRGVFVTVQARLVVDDSTKADDRERARLLLSVGADAYTSRDAPYSKDSNRGIGLGRFKYVTREWRAFNMITLPAEEARRVPPPLE
jgi:hypothetical protein